MISCVDFIPAYSELFAWLDQNKGGHEEVKRFWAYLFEPTGKGIPLINFIKKDGLRGAWNYWCGTLTEEAADCTRYFSEKGGWITGCMHYCPSKGHLLELAEEIGFEPYYDYCGHCDYYRASLEKEGLCMVRDHLCVDKASCRSTIYDPKVFDGVIVMEDDVEILEVKSADREYFHPDFHSSMNMGMEYVGANYGREAVKDYLNFYTEHVWRREMEAVKKDGLKALETFILDTYKREKAEDAVLTELTEDSLRVKISYCPAVKHLKKTGREVSSWYRYTAEDILDRLAKEIGYTFIPEAYEEETGAASYRFEK